MVVLRRMNTLFGLRGAWVALFLVLLLFLLSSISPKQWLVLPFYVNFYCKHYLFAFDMWASLLLIVENYRLCDCIVETHYNLKQLPLVQLLSYFSAVFLYKLLYFSHFYVIISAHIVRTMFAEKHTPLFNLRFIFPFFCSKKSRIK